MKESKRAATRCKPKYIEIIVNGRPKTVDEKKLCFGDAVELAFGTRPCSAKTIYTVTYTNAAGKRSCGSMVEGDCIRVQKGTILNVTPTDKS